MEKYYIISDSFISDVDNEVNELTDLLGVITSDDTIKDFKIEDTDLKIMKSRLSAFRDVKGMIKKASLDTGIDNTLIMTQGERAVFFRLVKFILALRRMVSIFKRK